MRSILCPTDFSANAEHAAKYGAGLANSLQLKLLLLHNYEAPVMLTEVAFLSIDATEKAIREEAESKMTMLTSKLSKQFPKLAIESTVAQGLAERKIVEYADNIDVEFIVMGTTGTTKLTRMMMGSTTARVIRHANCPVLCIPPTSKFKDINTIVYATDMHEDNIQSAHRICPLAKHFNAEMVFVFVDDKYVIHTEEGIQRMTKKIRKSINYPKISGYIVTNSSVTKGIEQFLTKHPADLLVMFTHEKYFPGTMFTQSITKIMSHQARIPLLSLKHSSKNLLADK